MTNGDDEDFENSARYWIYNNIYVDGDVKARDSCHMTGKYRDSAQRDDNINVKPQNSYRILQSKNIMLFILFC